MSNWLIRIFSKNKGLNEADDIVASVNNGVNIIDVSKSNTQSKEIDVYKITLNDSIKRINLLKIYNNYFNNRILRDIYNQTLAIHEIFEKNKDLKYNQLEQVHYMYTDTLLELLKKCKKTCDENESIITTQIKTVERNIDENNNIIKKYLNYFNNDKNEKLKYSRYISLQLSTIYNCLIDNFQDFRFIPTNKLFTFSLKEDTITFAYNISEELYNNIHEYNIDANYKYNGYYIDRKLLGKLNKNLFNIEFINLFKFNKSYIELFKIYDSNDYFIYISELNIFKLIKYSDFQPFMIEKNTKFGEIESEIADFNLKLSKLKIQLDNLLSFDDKIKTALTEYLAKIEDINFLNSLEEVDIERMNMEAVLKLTRLDI